MIFFHENENIHITATNKQKDKLKFSDDKKEKLEKILLNNSTFTF
jgi:hypothetical protein